MRRKMHPVWVQWLKLAKEGRGTSLTEAAARRAARAFSNLNPVRFCFNEWSLQSKVFSSLRAAMYGTAARDAKSRMLGAYRQWVGKAEGYGEFTRKRSNAIATIYLRRLSKGFTQLSRAARAGVMPR